MMDTSQPLYIAILAILIPAIVILVIAIAETIHIIRSIQNERRNGPTKVEYFAQKEQQHHNGTRDNNRQVKTMVVLGSGGHTTEMLQLLEELDTERYAPVIYVVADSDTTSIPRLQKYIREGNTQNGKRLSWDGRYPVEKKNDAVAAKENGNEHNGATVYRLPRAREVHQSYLSSIPTTLHALLQTIMIMWKVRPELVLANGPGTCVPVIYSAFLYRLLQSVLLRFVLLFPNNHNNHCSCCKVIFVESLCRVKSLSLSGKLVYPIVDQFVVHWPYLKETFPLVQVSEVFVRHDGHGD